MPNTTDWLANLPGALPWQQGHYLCQLTRSCNILSAGETVKQHTVQLSAQHPRGTKALSCCLFSISSLPKQSCSKGNSTHEMVVLLKGTPSQPKSQPKCPSKHREAPPPKTAGITAAGKHSSRTFRAKGTCCPRTGHLVRCQSHAQCLPATGIGKWTSLPSLVELKDRPSLLPPRLIDHRVLEI